MAIERVTLNHTDKTPITELPVAPSKVETVAMRFLNPAKDAVDLALSTEKRIHKQLFADIKKIETYQGQHAQLLKLGKELQSLKEDESIDKLSNDAKAIVQELDLTKDMNLNVRQLKELASALTGTIKSEQEVLFATKIQPKFQWTNAIAEFGQAVVRMNDRLISKTTARQNGG